MKQQITNIILEMIGEDKTFPELESDAYDEGYAKALQDLREKVPELVEKINNLIEYDKIKK